MGQGYVQSTSGISPIGVAGRDVAPSKPWSEIFAELYPPDEDPIRVPDWMAANLLAFHAAFDGLARQYPGQFALVHDGKVIGVYADEKVGLRDAYARFGRSAKFLLKCLTSETRPEQSMYHVAPECRS